MTKYNPIVTRPERIAKVHHAYEDGASTTLCHETRLLDDYGRPPRGGLVYGDGGLSLCHTCGGLLNRLQQEEKGIQKLKEHIVQPYEEQEFYPVMLYRGATPLGRVKAIYNYFCAAMEMELSSIGALATYASRDGHTSDIAHMSGIHAAYATDRGVFNRHGTRFLAHRELTRRTPHLYEYLEFLRDEGGLKLVRLSPVPRWTSWRTSRGWRYQPTDPGTVMPTFYPYVQEGQVFNDDEELLLTVERMVPKAIPEQIRGDVCQDIIVGILSGEMKMDTLAENMNSYVTSSFKRYPMKYGGLSLDAPLNESGFSLRDTLSGHYNDLGMCNRCETFTEELDGGLCAKCYDALEKELKAKAAMEHQTATKVVKALRHRSRFDHDFIESQDISLEQWREDNDGRAALRFPEEGVPAYLFEEKDHEGHDSNRRTDEWEADEVPYIYDGVNHWTGSLLGKRRRDRQVKEWYHASVERTEQEIKRLAKAGRNNIP